MMKKVIWSTTAAKSYRENLEYLQDKWTVVEIENFINEVDKAVQHISDNPYIGKVSDVSQHYSQLLVVKQITLYYRVTTDHIRLVCFFNNFKDPERLQEFLS